MSAAANVMPRRAGGAHTRRHEIITPEGVPLPLPVAEAGARAGAFLIDATIVAIAIIAIALAVNAMLILDANLAIIIASLAIFLIRHFYFTGFEIRWQGRTPGKRLLGLQVIDRRGGPLTTDAIFARNLTREIEVFIPLAVFLAPQQIFGGAPGIVSIFALVWVMILVLLPIFNRERLRVGDLVAGTIVVHSPRTRLLEDLVVVRDGAARREREPTFTFTPEQLDMYGVYELQVLEDLLRRRRTPAETLDAVCERIKTKIDWDHERWEVNTRTFLRDFYDAQRARLEQRMLFGDRRETKREGRLGDEGLE